MATTWQFSRRASAAPPERARKIFLLLLALALLPGLGCSDDDDDDVDEGVTASFTSSGTAAAPNLVRLKPGSAAADTVTVQVAISGPTTSADLYSFAFDLVLSDPAVAQYVAGSASVGGALVPTGGQGTTVLVTQLGSRVVVGVSKTGGGAGNAVAAGEQVLVTLAFRILRVGVTTVTFSGAPGSSAAALDSTGAVIASVTFDAAPATLSGT